MQNQAIAFATICVAFGMSVEANASIPFPLEPGNFDPIPKRQFDRDDPFPSAAQLESTEVISSQTQNITFFPSTITNIPPPPIFLKTTSPLTQSNSSDRDPIPNITVLVDRIEVVGSTVFSAEELESITNPLIGQEVSLKAVMGAADAIAGLYAEQGYINSTAFLPDQDITDGNILIQVIEGTLSEIEVYGTTRLNPNYVRSRLAAVATTPLKLQPLEDRIRLLQADPLFEEIDLKLQPGDKPGEAVAIVNVRESPPVFGLLFSDNNHAPSTGSEQFGVNLGYRNVTGWGDTFSLGYGFAEGDNTWNASYTIPLNAQNGALRLRTVQGRTRIIQDIFAELGLRGRSSFYEINFRQPLIENTREILAVSLGFTHQEGQTFLFNDIGTPFGIGPDENGVSRTSVFRLGADYTLRDRAGAWGFRSQLNWGTGLLNATHNSGDIPDGQFVSLSLQAQRAQRLSEDFFLFFQGDIQLSPDNLLGSDIFAIGGLSSVRGYRTSTRSADNGWRFTMEGRWILQRDSDRQMLTLAPFLDLGAVWNNSTNPNTLPDATFLAGAGLGIIFSPLNNLEIRLDAAVPLVNLSDRGVNAQDDGLYFRVSYRF